MTIAQKPDPLSQSALDQAYGCLGLGILITDAALDAPGPLIRYVNAAMSALTGYARDELIGTSPRIFQGPHTSRAILDDMRAALISDRCFHAEAVNYRRDGTEYIVEWWISAMLNTEGGVNGWLSVQRDVTDRRLNEIALRHSEERFRQFANASSNVLWIRNVDTLAFEFISPGFEAITGMSRGSLLDQDDGTRFGRIVHADDLERVRDDMQRVRSGESTTHEFRIIRPTDGQTRWLRSTAYPMRDENGRITTIGGIAEDVTVAKLASLQLQALTAELQHRTHNLMAVVTSISERAIRSSASLTDFTERFKARMASLSRTQSLLSRRDGHDRVTLYQILAAELEAVAPHPETVSLEGPPGVQLRSNMVQTIAIAIHELAINALKYGALAQEQARLSILWTSRHDENRGEWLHILWKESNVAFAQPHPQQKNHPADGGIGFVIRSLSYQLDAIVEHAIEDDGVRCTIALPISAG